MMKSGLPSDFDPNAAADPSAGIFGLDTTPEEARVILIPLPFEATTSYGGGTSQAPRAILQASHQVDLFDIRTGRPYQAGLTMLPENPEVVRWNEEARAAAEPVIAAGGGSPDPGLLQALEKVNEFGARLNEFVAQETDRWLHQGKRVGIVGGDHSVPFGAIQVIAQQHPGLGLLQVDAHADLRQAYEGFAWSHASIMYNVLERIPEVSRLVQVGIRDFCEEEFEYIRARGDRVRTHFDAHLKEQRFKGMCWYEQVKSIVSELPDRVYLSVDIDGLEPSLCPSTGTPVPGGLSFEALEALLREVVDSGREIVGFDLCEVAPSPQGGEWDANVGARVLYKLIGFALLSSRGE